MDLRRRRRLRRSDLDPDGDRWVIKSELVLSDGKKIAATNIITHVDADTMTWQSKDRTVDGKPVPDVKEIKMKRVK